LVLRRQWVEDRIRLLSSLFAVDICSYAVMSNHYHIVVKLSSTQDWSDQEVLQRWLTLHKGPVLIQRYQGGEVLSPAEKMLYPTSSKSGGTGCRI
jgi:REP element-mobilizing transposase RayT